MTARHVVILGAGSAGTAAARALAGRGDVRTTVVGRTDEIPYSRMLVKNVAYGQAAPEMIRLPRPDGELVADTVERVDPATREVDLASGASITYDALVVATGSRPRGLDLDVPGAEQAARAGRLLTLHSLDDAVRIRGALAARGESAHVAIYGGGLIASETASTLQAQGHRVSLVARSRVPGVAGFGRPVAERVAADHEALLTTFFGRTVHRVLATPDATVVTLDDGSVLEVDLVVVALGTTPAAPAPWRDGVAVDDRLRATGHGAVYAAGGVTVHHDDHLGTWRIDHWEDSAAQGVHAAQTVLHDLDLGEDPGPYRPRSAHLAVIHGRMITGVGYTGHPGTRVVPTDGLVVLHEQEGTVVGVSGIDAVGEVYGWGSRLHEARAQVDRG
ncbi:FAD-dependent oxidoreductase [Oerskovia jenensis]|uniref:NADPH-dependent 2,4-dienoyl-CoA reductase/sulfur reductase-like enzyme n=1 Tax=Oerskovia jenensis TaxID=162169 RepID=A0ABS2LH96_9CELL|nr:NAD(P)/FAD-dependent oxidoreductase [Oerskovia jenensis]MBM7479234.1 NADPH-dependent 2,4-dienoyl-CoA reductase/sulfur reductase-like enzyme [Oerskovia jenensis]